MKQVLAVMVMGIGLLYMIEGMANAITKKRSRLANFVEIFYPMFVVGTMIYFLASGTIK